MASPVRSYISTTNRSSSSIDSLLTLLCIHTSSPSSYSHFYVGSKYDAIRLHAARSYTSSASSPFSFISSFTLSNHNYLRSSSPPYPLYFSLPSHSFLRSVPFFSSHAHTTSTLFPVLSLCSPPLSLSLLFFHF